MMKKIIFIITIMVLLISSGLYVYINMKSNKPEQVLKEYVAKINEEKYEEMYEMIDVEIKQKISKEDFIQRNKNIYQGIEMTNMKITIDEENISSKSLNQSEIKYNIEMNTSGGVVSFENIAILKKSKENQYKIVWNSNFIFPNLDDTDKVKISKKEAKRGSLIDRNGNIIATNGTASSIGIVPGKLGDNREENIKKIAEFLNMEADAINNKLVASWVKDDSFVPIKTVAKTEIELKENLLTIPGVKITSVEAREYPLGKAAAHLTGYVQTITKEELEKNPEYSQNSIIGKNGLEKLYESRLKGNDGVEIYIVDEAGNKKSTIISTNKVDGEDIKLTIDYNIQYNLYNELKNDEGLFVVMNPKTGELLALVSTPSYDVNKISLGISNAEWQELSNDTRTPMLARYLQSYCPGSTFKPITGAIGLTTGSLSKDDTFSYSGLSWQKDKNWGDFNITTLTAYSGAKNLKNALIHSDNIYFAQATLKIGKQNFINGLKKLKFNEKIDWDLNIAKSQYSNSETISSEGALADSGYGQGEILVNPIHMASIYSSFVNDGNMVKPYLEYKEDKQVEYLVENAFTQEAVEEIKQDLIQVVENPEGTAKDMRINGLTIAGKTGTAELKASREETADTIGWFDCFTVREDNPYLVIGMCEHGNVNGGSHYVIPKIRRMFIK